MSYQIRQLNLGGILDDAVQLTKNNFGLLFGITSALLIPYLVVEGFIELAISPVLPPNPKPEDVLAFQQEALKLLPITVPMALVAALVIMPVTNAAMIRAIANRYLGKTATVGQSIGSAFRGILPLVGTWVLLFLAVAGGMLLCIVPGILAAFWFTLSTQVVVLEGSAGTAALSRSKELMTGNIGTFFVLSLLIAVINISVGFAAAFIPQAHVRVVGVAIVQAALSIFSTAAVVVFYFSCRCKHEQFDLQILAQAVGEETLSPAAEDGESNRDHDES